MARASLKRNAARAALFGAVTKLEDRKATGYAGLPSRQTVVRRSRILNFRCLTTFVICITNVLWSRVAMLEPWSETPMPLPNYAGRLFDKIILVVIQQTGSVKPNPDDGSYPDARSAVLKATAWALFRARNELQQMRREQEQKAKESAKQKIEP